MPVRLPYETKIAYHEAQLAIQDVLDYMGATEVLFIAEGSICTVSWQKNGHEHELASDAKRYIKLWFQLEPWHRDDSPRERHPDQHEQALAVINYWFVLRDQWIDQIPHLVYKSDKAFRFAERATAALIAGLQANKPSI